MNSSQLQSDHNQSSLAPLRERFFALYGAGAVRCLRAPARINVLGEHIDYVSYLPTASLPFGSDAHAMTMLWRPRAAGMAEIRGASLQTGYAPFAFTLAQPTAAPSWEAWLQQAGAPVSGWQTYVAGAAYFAQWQAGRALTHGIDFLIDSTIPPRGGSSSSSALTVLAGAALRLANELDFTPATLALDSAQAEWYCGTRGGALDHTAICLSQPQHIIHLRHHGGQPELLPWPTNDHCWVTFFSHEADKGNAVMLAYNERAAVARVLIPALLADLSAQRPDFALTWQRAVQTLDYAALRDCLHELPPCVTLAEMARHYRAAFAECERLFPALVREQRHEPLIIAARALYHLGEVERVQQAVHLLQASTVNAQTAAATDKTMRELGALLNATHESLRNLYEVSTPEVEVLRETLLTQTGVLGARLMGGGFGGNVLALIERSAITDVVEHTQERYYTPRERTARREGAVMISVPGAGLTQCD